MGKKKEFKVPSRKQPFYPILKVIMRILYKKPKKIINLAGEIEEKAIVLANHSAKSGPPCLDLYYPKSTCKWGAYQMLGNYKMRKAYLRDVLYIQKCHKKPGFGTSLKASLLAIVSPLAYKGMRVMATYPDTRFTNTVRNSVKVLDAGYSVMIYPENSNEGYEDVLKEFYPGFVMLANVYFKHSGVDLPVYPVYYSVKKRILVIGKPLYVQALTNEGLSLEEICAKLCSEVNGLYYEYVEKE
jgi:1-acyl-sn-glycerol-3-phosphate acyltransferase